MKNAFLFDYKELAFTGQDFYNEMVRVQQYLLTHDRLIECVQESSFDKLLKRNIERFACYKKYYICQFALYQSFLNSPIFKHANFLNGSNFKQHFSNNNKISLVQENIEKVLEKACKKKMKAQANDESVHSIEFFIDYITFNIIPSHFNFFITEKEFNRYLNFLQSDKIQDDSDLKISLLRPIFVIPSFLCFFHNVFFEPFKPILHQEKPFDPDELAQVILDRVPPEEKWPHFISKLLSEFAEIKTKIILKCLLEPLFNHPERFMFYDLSHRDPFLNETFLPAMKDKICTDDFANMFCQKLAVKNSEKGTDLSFLNTKNKIERNNEKALVNPLLSEKVEEMNPEFFNFRIIDYFDESICSKKRNSLSSTDFNELDNSYFYTLCNINSNIDDHKKSTVDKNSDDSIDIQTEEEFFFTLLQLIKEAPILNDRKIDENDILKIIENYCIDKNNSLSVSKAVIMVEQLKEQIKYYKNHDFPSSKEFLHSYFNKKCKKQTNKYLKFADIDHELETIFISSKPAMEYISNIFLFDLFKKLDYGISSESKSIGDIIWSPTQFNQSFQEKICHFIENNDFLINFHDFTNPIFSNNYIQIIKNCICLMNEQKFPLFEKEIEKIKRKKYSELYGLVYCKGLKFYDFLCFREDLNYTDAMFNELIRFKFADILLKIKNVFPEFCNNFYHCYFDEFKENVVELQNAFKANVNPQTKFDMISQAIDNSIEVFNRKINVDQQSIYSLSSDYFILLLLVLSNPEKFISNLVYLLDFPLGRDFTFISKEDKKKLDLLIKFCDLVASVDVILNESSKFTFHPKKYSKLLNKNMSILIVEADNSYHELICMIKNVFLNDETGFFMFQNSDSYINDPKHSNKNDPANPQFISGTNYNYNSFYNFEILYCSNLDNAKKEMKQHLSKHIDLPNFVIFIPGPKLRDGKFKDFYNIYLPDNKEKKLIYIADDLGNKSFKNCNNVIKTTLKHFQEVFSSEIL